MKFFIQLILVVLLTYLTQLIMPWWGVFIATAITGMLVRGKGVATFLAGLLGVALLWFGQMYVIDVANESILSTKVAAIFGLSSPFMLMLVASLAGGLAGGFGALTGKLFIDLFKRQKESYTVYN